MENSRCLLHGGCFDGTCHCNQGWGGAHCTLDRCDQLDDPHFHLWINPIYHYICRCPHACSGNGECVRDPRDGWRCELVSYPAKLSFSLLGLLYWSSIFPTSREHRNIVLATSLTKEQVMTPSVHCTICLCLCLCIVLLVQDIIMNQEQQWWQQPQWNIFCSNIKNCPVICWSKSTCHNLSGDLH